MVFRNALLLCGVCDLQYKTLWMLNETGGGLNRKEEVGLGKFGLGMGVKRGKVSRD
jgi:hypothetical protein